MRGKVSVIQHVVGKLGEQAAGIEFESFQCGVANLDFGATPASSDAQTHLAPIGQLAAKVHADMTGANAISSDDLVPEELVDILLFGLRVRSDKITRVKTQGLIELSAQRRFGAELHIGAPFRAERIQAGPRVASRNIKARRTLEIVLQRQAELQVVGPPAFTARVEFKPDFCIFVDDAVRNVFVERQSKQARRIRGRHGRVDWLACCRSDSRFEHAR